jgi:serine/threonine protein kinase
VLSRYDGFKADMWSCGVCLFCMTECRFPFSVTGDGGAGVRASHAPSHSHTSSPTLALGQLTRDRQRSASVAVRGTAAVTGWLTERAVDMRVLHLLHPLHPLHLPPLPRPARLFRHRRLMVYTRPPTRTNRWVIVDIVRHCHQPPQPTLVPATCGTRPSRSHRCASARAIVQGPLPYVGLSAGDASTESR